MHHRSPFPDLRSTPNGPGCLLTALIFLCGLLSGLGACGAWTCYSLWPSPPAAPDTYREVQPAVEFRDSAQLPLPEPTPTPGLTI